MAGQINTTNPGQNVDGQNVDGQNVDGKKKQVVFFIENIIVTRIS